ATIASAITYMTEKKLSGNSDSFGKGDIRGVAAPEAANNASACVTSVDSQNVPRFPGTTPCCPGQRSIQRKCFMAAITTGVVLLR
ncbi:tripartite tricarboxylate transporter permease, partial [Salmonella enterica subsp. enterica serovar Kentucky]|nr:tripartite tricarboxylate transporter permease [Salmonella enterica subsp. enterica serovar Kentucky]